MSELTPRKARKLEVVVRSWRLAPGPETTLQIQAADALGEYAALLKAGHDPGECKERKNG